MNWAESVDVGLKSRHPDRVGEKKQYWDHRECAWVPCETPLGEIPEQAEAGDGPTSVEPAMEADVRSG